MASPIPPCVEMNSDSNTEGDVEQPETVEGENEKIPENETEGWLQWFKGPTFAIYFEFFISSWGDRMWHFAVGLYLTHFNGGPLRLAAVYGFFLNITVLLFMSSVGHWVDKHPRLKVMRTSLFIQNLTVALCAVGVGLLLIIQQKIDYKLSDLTRYSCIGVIMLLAIVAELASQACKIAVSKDWIVVVSKGNKSLLANLNAVSRSLDLSCKVLAPTVVGQVMTYGSLLMAAVFITAWNILFVFVEYGLLVRVYKLVPRLAYKEDEGTQDEDGDEVKKMVVSENKKDKEKSAEEQQLTEKSEDGEPVQEPVIRTKEQKSCVQHLFGTCITLTKGWTIYRQQLVVYAGISLASLYMTVMGFDYITIGYLYSQNISASILGVVTALAGLTGIIGSFLYTWARRRFGLERSGLMAFGIEIAMLSLTVASIWAPGSPFDPTFSRPEIDCNDALNGSTHMSDTGLSNLMKTENESHNAHEHEDLLGLASAAPLCNKTPIYTSAILFLCGIVLSRIGLWMADLVVTQLYQENVREKERGIVNGVQNSLNSLVDTFKFIMVFTAPHPQTFGLLIIASFICICGGGGFFVKHVCRMRKREMIPVRESEIKS